jgi:hypothetical protein
MARYFFHAVNGGRDRDTAGMELPDEAAARTEAIRFAGSILANEPAVLCGGGGFRIEATDQTQRLLLTVIALAIDAPLVEPE